MTTAPRDAAGPRPPAGFRHGAAHIGGVRLHYVVGGTGAPLFLLHGFPQTWWAWHRVLPALAERFTVVAPDGRGLGDSDRPAGGYDKRTAAEDVYGLARTLGFETLHLAGHDIGGMVAYACARAHPETVRRLAVLDVLLPGFGLEEAVMDLSAPGRGFWHFPFHMAPDVPEALVAGRERLYVGWHHERFAFHPSAITPADLDEYARCYAAPGALRAGFGYYRALFEDAAFNRQEMDAHGGGKLALPVLALGGEHGAGEWTADSLRRAADDVRGGVVADCGHFIPEEQPAELTRRFLDFFSD